MADNHNMLVRANLKQLKLPAMGAEFTKLAREAADANEDYEQYLLRLSELEVAARASNAVQARTRAAGFPVAKDFDTFDFSAVPSLSKPKVLELARRVDRAADQHLLHRQPGDRQNAPGHRTRTGRLSARQARTLRDGGDAGDAPGGSAEAVPARPRAGAARPHRPVDLRRAGLPVVQSGRRRAAVPGVRRPLRAAQPAGDEQPGLQRMEPGLPGRADDGSAAGPADAPLSNL